MQPKDRYRIVLADDHALFRHDLMRLIMEDCHLEVVGDVCDGLELLKFLKATKFFPNLAIIDISMPNLGGIDVAARIKSIYPDIKVLILSMHKDKEYICKAFSVGANGYLLKMDVSAYIFSAIEKIREGDVYLSPLLSEKDDS